MVRVLSFERSTFASVVDWAFAVLGVSLTEHSLASVQKCYRALMKKLHPDKAAQSSRVIDAVEMIQDAKAICERSLCHHEVPGVPRLLSATMQCAKVGHRRWRMRWLAPERLEIAPVQRYVVAVADPSSASKHAIRVSTLEPDYSQELGRYVTLEELANYEIAEEDVYMRVPGLFLHKSLTLMVAAANKVGQSSWASVSVDLALTEQLSRTCTSRSTMAPASGSPSECGSYFFPPARPARPHSSGSTSPPPPVIRCSTAPAGQSLTPTTVRRMAAPTALYPRATIATAQSTRAISALSGAGAALRPTAATVIRFRTAA